MQRLAARVGGRAVPVAAGVVAATATAPVALADAHAPRDDAVSPHHRRVEDDGWHIFDAQEIDNAISCLVGARPAQATPPAVVVEELAESDALSTDGTVDAVIERSGFGGDALGPGGLPLDLHEVCTLASRLLKTPGVQREICAAALSDPEIFDILASKGDMAGYLQSAGFAATGLLRGPEGAEASDAEGAPAAAPAAPPAAVPDCGGGGGVAAAVREHLARATGAVAGGVEDVGQAIVRLGQWMRGQLLGEQQGSGSGDGDGAARGLGKGVERMLGAALVVAVAAVALMLCGRPEVRRTVVRAMKAAASKMHRA